jgi:DUF971 family protein
MDPSRPRVITKSDPSRIAIEWEDGHVTSFSAKALRDLCPCARCIDEVTGRPLHDPGKVPADLTTREVHLVGLYALAATFSDGHATGIYPFRMLRAADPAAPAPSTGGDGAAGPGGAQG